MISTIGGFFDLNHFDQSSRANDVIVIRHRDGSLHSTPFNVRFGRARIWNSANKVVQVEVNGVLTSAVMKIGKGGEAFWLHPTYIRQQRGTHTETASHQRAEATRRDEAVLVDSEVKAGTQADAVLTRQSRASSVGRGGTERALRQDTSDHVASAVEEEAHNAKQENAKLAREALAAAAKAEQRLSKLRLNEGPFLWELPANGKDSTSMSAVGGCAPETGTRTTTDALQREPTQDLKDAMPPSSPTEYGASAPPGGEMTETRSTPTPPAAATDTATAAAGRDDRPQAVAETGTDAHQGNGVGEDSGTSNVPDDSDGAADEDDVYTLDPIELNEFGDSLRHHRRPRAAGTPGAGGGSDEGDGVSSDELLNSSFGSSVTSGVSVEVDPPHSDAAPRASGTETRAGTHSMSSSATPHNGNAAPAATATGGHGPYPAGAVTEHPLQHNELDMATEHDAVRHGQTYFTRSLVPTLDDLRKLNLREGCNEVRYITYTNFERRTVSVTCNIFLWDYTARLVISDVDGTITKSDMWGHFYAMFGKGAEWTHPGICSLYSKIAHNGYHMIYLTARSVTQIYQTKNYLWSLVQDDQQRLPLGPVLTAPQRIFTAIKKEVSRQSHVFKIACLNSVLAAFPTHAKPFFAGFGNRYNDVVSYSAVNIPTHKIFIIDPSSVLHVCRVKHTYRNLVHLVDVTFPPIRVRSCVIYALRSSSQQPAAAESHPAVTPSRKPPATGQPRSPSSSTSGAAAGPSEGDEDGGLGSDANSLSSLSEDEYAREAMARPSEGAGSAERQLLLRPTRGAAFYLSNSSAVTRDTDVMTMPGGGGKTDALAALQPATGHTTATEDTVPQPSAPPLAATARSQGAASSGTSGGHYIPSNAVMSAAPHLSAPTSDDELHVDPDFGSFQYWHVDPRDLISTPRPPLASRPATSVVSGPAGPSTFGVAAGMSGHSLSGGRGRDGTSGPSAVAAADGASIAARRDAEPTASSETTSGNGNRKAGSFFSRVWPHASAAAAAAITTQDHSDGPPPKPSVTSAHGYMHPDYMPFPLVAPAQLAHDASRVAVATATVPLVAPHGEPASTARPAPRETEESTVGAEGVGMRATGDPVTAPASTSWAFWKKAAAREGSGGARRKDEDGAATQGDERATQLSEGM